MVSFVMKMWENWSCIFPSVNYSVSEIKLSHFYPSSSPWTQGSRKYFQGKTSMGVVPGHPLAVIGHLTQATPGINCHYCQNIPHLRDGQKLQPSACQHAWGSTSIWHMTASLANDSNDSEDNNIGLVPMSWRTYSVLCCLQKTVALFLKVKWWETEK